MKRYHEERARIRSEHRLHLRYVHHWPRKPVDCECELQAGRFRKKKALDCGKAACLLCHYEKIFGLTSYNQRLRLLRAKDTIQHKAVQAVDLVPDGQPQISSFGRRVIL